MPIVHHPVGCRLGSGADLAVIGLCKSDTRRLPFKTSEATESVHKVFMALVRHGIACLGIRTDMLLSPVGTPGWSPRLACYAAFLMRLENSSILKAMPLVSM